MEVTEEQQPKDLDEDDIQMLLFKDHSNFKTLNLFRNSCFIFWALRSDLHKKMVEFYWELRL